ncbi:MAG TPA: CvpA family protein [Candidatus Saccharimonadales bacterium]|nr:CvpA family protein [Candidatus Saccharimonadales bacterium]
MNWVDLIVLIVLVLFALRGFLRGFFREIFSLAGLIAGFMLAAAYERSASAFIASYWQMSPLVLQGVAFVAIFFSVYFLLSLIGWLLHRSEKLLFLKTVNRAGGIAIGMGKGVAVAALAVFFLSSSLWLPQAAREKFIGAYSVPPLSRLADNLIRLGKEKIFTDKDVSDNSAASALHL